MSVLILPAALIVALFSRELLLLWTRNPVTAEHTRILLSLLVIGTALNGLMNLPYAMQLAHGWTRLAFFTNVVAVVLLAPCIILLAKRYGAVGAASVWVILNGGYVLISIHIMHRLLLKGEKWRWYREDVGLPLAATLLVAGVGRWLLPSQLPLALMLLCLSMIGTLALVAAVLGAPQIRRQLLDLAHRAKVNYAARYAKPAN